MQCFWSLLWNTGVTVRQQPVGRTLRRTHLRCISLGNKYSETLKLEVLTLVLFKRMLVRVSASCAHERNETEDVFKVSTQCVKVDATLKTGRLTAYIEHAFKTQGTRLSTHQSKKRSLIYFTQLLHIRVKIVTSAFVPLLFINPNAQSGEAQNDFTNDIPADASSYRCQFRKSKCT